MYVNTLSKGSLFKVITLASKVPVTVALVTLSEVAVIPPDMVAPVAVINPDEETVKFPEPIFISPAVIEPRSADIAERFVTLISLAVITFA